MAWSSATILKVAPAPRLPAARRPSCGAYQNRGQSLRVAVNGYHKGAEGKSLIDYAFHVILTHPSQRVMDQDFTALVADGYTSLKLYMTYDGLKLTDREMLDALAAARCEQAIQDKPSDALHGLCRVKAAK